MSPQEKAARRSSQPFPNNLRLAVSPQDKLDALLLGRKIKEFVINELKEKENDTHIKVLFAALQYVFYWVGGLDAQVSKANNVEGRIQAHAQAIGLNKLEAEMQEFQDSIIVNGVMEIINKSTESGYLNEMVEPYSEAFEQVQEEEEIKKQIEAAQKAGKTPEQAAADLEIQDALNSSTEQQS